MRKITNDVEFEAVFAESSPVILDFYAGWCGPCKALLPVLEAVSEEHQEVLIAKINVDDNPELAARFNVRSIPSVFFIKDRAVVDQFVGIQSKAEIVNKITHLIAVKEGSK